jgi:glycosidase
MGLAFRFSFTFGPLLTCAALVACGDDTYINENPPSVGGYDPGNTTATGYGAGYGQSGVGGTGGAPPPMCEDEYKLCAAELTYPDMGEQSVELRGSFKPDGWTSGVPMVKDGALWKATFDVSWATDFQYKFVLNGTTWITDPNNPNQVDDGFGGFNSLFSGITCPDEFKCAPPILGYDWRDAVLYFVFVDRFFDGNPANNGPAIGGVETPAAYQGGDFAGVTQKIEAGYFDELGVNTLWISVPLDNADVSGIGDDGHYYSAYHGYWPTNLDQTEGRQGTMAELQALVQAAHARDIKVIVDYAMNHVHSSSPVYQQHPDWFWPNQNGGNNCVCGQGCSWDGAEGKRCWFRDYLPDFDFTNTAARNFSVDNALWWINQTGVDGFRLDAVKHIEDSWLLDLRSRIKTEIEPTTQQHFYMVGETFTGDKATIAYYVNPSTMLDGQFDFPLRHALVGAVLARSSSMNDLNNFLVGNDGYYGAGVMSTFIGNHDVPRSIHFAQDQPVWTDPWAGGKEKAWSGQPGLPGGMSAFERMATAFAVIYTLPGVPLIYYGDEVGMPGAGDPDNRRFMQWSGYSQGQSFLKSRVSALAAVRAAHPALRRGTRETVHVNNDTLVYKMQDGTDVVYVAINRSDSQQTVNGLPAGALTDEIDSSSHQGPSLAIPPRTARVLVPN